MRRQAATTLSRFADLGANAELLAAIGSETGPQQWAAAGHRLAERATELTQTR